jgi:ATP-dependent RNA helicase DeaD
MRRPVVMPSLGTALLERDAARRAEVLGAMEGVPLDAAFYALAPLFERHEPQHVAAACYALWRQALVPVAAPRREAAPVQSATPVGGGSAMAKLWVGAGKKDEATPGDLVAVLVKEAGLDRTLIGRIELRDTFSLVEVPASEADRLAAALTGLTIRRRRLVARVDRGIPARSGPGRGAPRRG